MNKEKIKKLLTDVAGKKVSVGDAMDRLKHMPFDEMDFAKVDGHRHIRNGFSEVIFCQGKTTDQIISIAKKMVEHKMNVLGTRCAAEVGNKIAKQIKGVDYDPVSNTFVIMSHKPENISGRVAVLCAGTADIRTAEESRRTLEFFGADVKTFYDVGVAGIHRLISQIKELEKFDVLIAVAGMEGALASVLGGLVSRPIVAVPTSIGYGSNFGGITPLLAMLNSCSEGISVVNIDNGFGAACAAMRILRKCT
jgi:NCAIR mutase (PurE)-related protein